MKICAGLGLTIRGGVAIITACLFRFPPRNEDLEVRMLRFCQNLWSDEQGQDIAEYAVMLAVILVLVIGTVRLIGGNANNAFSSVANSLNQ